MSLRLVALGAGVAAVVALAAYVGHLRSSVAAETARADHAEEQWRLWSKQAELNAATARIGERRASNVARTVSIANEAIHEIEAAPDLDAALGAYARQLDRVRASGHAAVTDGPAPDVGSERPDADAGPDPAPVPAP